MIAALTGSNALAVKQRLLELTEKFASNYGDLALERIDANEVEAKTIIDTVQSVPFLAKRKMVILRDLAANKAAAEQVEQIISSTSDAVDLIFYEPLTDKRTVFYMTLKKKTQFEEYDEMEVHELPKWLMNEAKKLDGELSFADAKYLVDRVGANQYLLSNELAKLITFDPKSTRDSINLLTEQTPQSKIFELLDASFGTRKDKALELYEQQRAQKVEPQAILAMIAWQLQLIALMKNAGGLRTSEVARDSGVNEFPLRKAAGLASKVGNDQLKQMISGALEIDWKSKTSPIDLDEALKTYIITL